MPRRPDIRHPGWWLLALVLYSGVIHFAYLGRFPFISHEARAAIRTEGLMNEGGWIVPQFYDEGSGEPMQDFQKPPLPFWIAGALSKLTGRVDPWTMRAPQAAASILTMLLLVLWVRQAACWRIGLVTGLVYTTSYVAIFYGRRAEVDAQLVLFTVAAMYAYWQGVARARGWGQAGWFALAWAALGATVLIKGPIAVVVFGAMVLAMVLIAQEARRWRVLLRLAVTAPVLLLVAAPWYLYCLHAHPQAYDVWRQHSVGRVEGNLAGGEVWWFYLLHAPKIWAPWLVAIPVGVWAAAARKRVGPLALKFLLAWAVGGLVILSISKAKWTHYSLLFTPPVLVFAGIGLDWILYDVPVRLRGLAMHVYRAHWMFLPLALTAVGAVGLAKGVEEYRGVCIAMIAAGIFAQSLVAVLYLAGRRGASVFVAVLAGAAGIGLLGAYIIPPYWPYTVFAAGGGGVLGALAFWWYGAGRRTASALAFAGAVLVASVVTYGEVVGRLQQEYFQMPIAARIIREEILRDDVSAIEQPFCQFPKIYAPLVYYVGRPMRICTKAEELEAWRRENPHGVIFVKNEFFRLLPEGTDGWSSRWRKIPLHRDEKGWRLDKYSLMIAIGDVDSQPATAPADEISLAPATRTATVEPPGPEGVDR